MYLSNNIIPNLAFSNGCKMLHIKRFRVAPESPDSAIDPMSSTGHSHLATIVDQHWGNDGGRVGWVGVID